ncbi:MAG: T9SS type A sorting domain-containing protein [Bacteroidales bacterium]|nr:T9SS type A sorting domain-containing protein [Bacteroidales bacterium]
MKKILFIILVSVSAFSFAQQQEYLTFQYDTTERVYARYVPAIYDSSESVPLVICLHGLGDTITNFVNIGMNLVADTANFIVLTSQAQSSAFGTAWNSGASYYGYVLNGNVDDVGFLNALIDSTRAYYNIDTNRIFVTGFSMGGFMSNRLASELNDKIAAIASVSGTIGESFNPGTPNPIPVCHFHGTADGTVAYTGDLYGMDAEELVNFWIGIDNCDTVPVIDSVLDIAADGKTVVHYIYPNGNNGTQVEFYKIIGGEHEWLMQPTNDISYTVEIWKFFSQFPLQSSQVNTETNQRFQLFPNPTTGNLYVSFSKSVNGKLSVFNQLGNLVKIVKISSLRQVINLENLPQGVYFVRFADNTTQVTQRIVLVK